MLYSSCWYRIVFGPTQLKWPNHIISDRVLKDKNCDFNIKIVITLYKVNLQLLLLATSVVVYVYLAVNRPTNEFFPHLMNLLMTVGIIYV